MPSGISAILSIPKIAKNEEETRVTFQRTLIMALSCLVLGWTCAGVASPPAAGDATVAYDQLADLLEDEHSRAVIIEELRALAAGGEIPETDTAAPGQETATQGEAPEMARRLAASTGELGERVRSDWLAMRENLRALVTGEARGVGGVALGGLMARLGLLTLIVYAAFFALRMLARPLFGRLNGWAERGSRKFALLHTLSAVSLAGVVDLALVGVSYAVGGVVASTLTHTGAAQPELAALLLNAFLLVEGVKVGLRMLFATGHEALRLLPLGAADALSCHRFFAVLIAWVGYGTLAAAPLAGVLLGAPADTWLRALILVVAFLYFVFGVLRARSRVRALLGNRAEQASGASRACLRGLAWGWPWLAIGYALAVLSVSMIQPRTALTFVAVATFETLVYVGIALLLLRVIRQWVGHEIQLSAELNARMPKLQEHINTYLPRTFQLVGLLVLSVALVLSLDAWRLLDLGAWYDSAAGAQTLGSIIDILVVLIVATTLWILLASLIEQRLQTRANGSAATAARAETLLGLFHTALAITILVITTMIVLSEIGVDIGPLIAGAGVIGLALGFGSQKLVQDVITGVFIQLENAMNTGEFVEAGGLAGTVERVGIRSVALRDLYGTYHIVPFSAVDAVSNYTREFANHVGEYGIAYRESIDEAVEQLQAAFEELQRGEHKDDILAPLNVAGVTALADSSVNIRAVIKTRPGMQWAVGRAYNRLVKIHFDKAGIEIPFPHTTLYFGADKAGAAPPANVRICADDGARTAALPGVNTTE